MCFTGYFIKSPTMTNILCRNCHGNLAQHPPPAMMFVVSHHLVTHISCNVTVTFLTLKLYRWWCVVSSLVFSDWNQIACTHITSNGCLCFAHLDCSNAHAHMWCTGRDVQCLVLKRPREQNQKVPISRIGNGEYLICIVHFSLCMCDFSC